MASSKPSHSEEELTCPFCSRRLREPKILPDCLHRICKNCLDGLIRATPTKLLLCLICETEYAVPEQGVDGFKTDVRMEEIIESLPKEQLSRPNIPQTHGRQVHYQNQPSEETAHGLLEESSMSIEMISANGWKVFGIANNNEGTMVLSGRVNWERSVIISIYTQGRVIHHWELDAERGSRYPANFFCDFLSESKVAIACMSGQVGIYNLRDKNYNYRRMADIFSTWPDNRFLTCVAVDRANCLILVGAKFQHGRGTDILVFNKHLDFLHTLVLPGVVQHNGGMVVNNDNLLVCDRKAHRSFIFTMDGGRKMIRRTKEFARPECFVTGKLSIASACIADNSPYLMWADVKGENSCWHLVKYSKDGSEMQQVNFVGYDGLAMCSSEIEGVEKIHISTCTLGKVYTYAITPQINHVYL